ncbi:Stk1 family PASTA domain-containing Ser/Thr kinase [Thermogemmatispora carboxidivorans]|uniref:Stk1 family PASTA domain-containing Ser/Thr kinase n=1 Tax=Thermogemmatispora carboxidivorans TaxID=1382306 RepID=UPI00069C21D1|nr:Stk1 family PASTA domain-containing Ser/Thr kinase [Thermogemmatispora carboxidivorans]
MQTEVLGERYQLLDPIGRGGMATIYRGRDLRMDRPVAIKVLREVYSTDPKFVTRFQREAKAASALQHPNIVQVYDYGQSDGNYYIVMELVEGTDLRRYLRSRGVLDVERAVIIAHDVALGLGAAHRRGIVHRDVKPQNILVGRDGSIKLTDFGIASVYKDINAERLTTTGMTLGTVQYYAPEQAQGEIVSPAADVYALGIVMYEMLTGRTPFEGDTPVAVAMQHIQDPPIPPSHYNPAIPPALEEIILRCLEKIPEMRYRDGSALARALEALGETELAEPVADVAAAPTVLTSPYRPSSSGVGHGLVNEAPIAAAAPGYDQPPLAAGPLAASPYAPPEAVPAPGPGPYGGFVQSGTTRPFQRDAIAGERGSRLAGIITALILIATVLLLGFSIYLASILGFVPFLHLSTQATPAPPEVPVPSLIGLTYQQALTRATNAGFVLQVHNGLTSGYVIRQSPQPPALAPRGSTILVDLQERPTRVIVPDGLVGNTLAGAERILRSQGIPFTVQSDGVDPTKPANYVDRTSPQSGQELPNGQSVILYVVNLSTGSPTSVPSATATEKPSPSPSPSPSPTPSPSPSPTPSPSPSPTAHPLPSVTVPSVSP